MAEPKRRTGRPRLESKKESILSLRGSGDFKRWFDRLVMFSRTKRHATDASDFIDKAIVKMAQDIGFEEEAPPR